MPLIMRPSQFYQKPDFDIIFEFVFSLFLSISSSALFNLSHNFIIISYIFSYYILN